MNTRLIWQSVFSSAIALLATDWVNAQSGTWNSYASLLTPALRPGYGMFNDSLYVIGGETGNGGEQNTVQVYNPTLNSWTSATPLPYNVQDCGVAGANSSLFVIGGIQARQNGSIATVLKYDPIADAWSSVNPLPVPKGSFATGLINGAIYVAGGDLYISGISITALDDTEKYDPLADQWTTLPSMPVPTRGPAFATVNNRLYVFGGNDPNGPTAAVYAFDPATNTWTSKSSMPRNHNQGRAAVLNGQVYVMGGDNNDGLGTTAIVDVYDPVSDTWSSGVPMPDIRDGFATGTLGSTVYFTGGENQNGVSTNTYGYTGPGPQSISDVITIINSQSSVNSGQQNSLTTKLKAAQTSIASGNSAAACGQLGAFINEVNARQHNGTLSQATATVLLNFTQSLKAKIGCP